MERLIAQPRNTLSMSLSLFLSLSLPLPYTPLFLSLSLSHPQQMSLMLWPLIWGNNTNNSDDEKLGHISDMLCADVSEGDISRPVCFNKSNLGMLRFSLQRITSAFRERVCVWFSLCMQV